MLNALGCEVSKSTQTIWMPAQRDGLCNHFSQLLYDMSVSLVPYGAIMWDIMFCDTKQVASV